jgi:TetR/AcrR family transcriptional regulator, transcriptional repressor for nem operon
MPQKRKSEPAREPNNRERVIAAAWDLFWSRGFHDTSIADIAAQARLPKGSIYNYFPSKDELLLFVMGRLKYEIETELRLQVLAGNLPPGTLVRRLCDHYEAIYGKHGFTRGDPLAGCLTELAATHPQLAARLLPIQQLWLQVVTQKIWAYATVADIPALIERAPSLAQQIYAGLQGALMLMKAQQSAEPLEEARRTLAPMVSVYVAALATGEVPEE